MSKQLPSCMMPDGAEPCKGYAELLAERDALQARLEEFANDVAADLGARNKERDALQADIEQLKNPWISIEDRLPEEGQRVRVYGTYWGEINGEGEKITAEVDWCLYGCLSLPSDAYEAKVKDVIHWMPIPKLEGKGDE